MSTENTWHLTRYPNLYRHKIGVYYARVFVNGKRTWRSLKTETLSIARARFAKIAEDEGKRKELQREHGIEGDRETLASAIWKHTEKQANDPALKPTTQHYYRQIEIALQKSLGDLGKVELSKVPGLSHGFR